MSGACWPPAEIPSIRPHVTGDQNELKGIIPMEPLRIGILGAARITELALVKPAAVTGTRLVAVAARDRSRAETFADTHGVERVLDSYDEVIADPEVEAVYNPLSNSLHATWNVAALEAGKHVLTEKPSAGNAAEAAFVEKVVAARDLVFFEGFHYYYHPLVGRLYDILRSGEIGTLQRVESIMDMPAPPSTDPRWSLQLAGGALMDLGCYSLHSHRMLASFGGGEPRVISATGAERPGHPGVDEWLTARLQFPNGVTGTAGCNMASDHHQMSHTLIGSAGEAVITDFVNPHNDDRLIVTTADESRTEHLGNRSSYTYQLEAFTRAVRTGAATRTDAAGAVATMQLIDECYRHAGFAPRPGQYE
jgi:predicted dehydrogenase